MAEKTLPEGALWLEAIGEELIPPLPRIPTPNACMPRNKLSWIADAFGFDVDYEIAHDDDGNFIRYSPFSFVVVKHDKTGTKAAFRCYVSDTIYHDEEGNVLKVVDWLNKIVFRDFKHYVAWRFPFLTPEDIEYISTQDIPDMDRMRKILSEGFERAKRREFPAIEFLKASLSAMRSKKAESAAKVKYPSLSPVPSEFRKKIENLWMDALSNLGNEELCEYLDERGFLPDEAADLGIGVTEEGDIAIPTFDLSGIRNLVYRLHDVKTGEYDRYALERPSVEPGYWWELGEGYEPVWKSDEGIYALAVVQGYLNAISWALAKPEHGVIGFQSSLGLCRELAEAIASRGLPVILSTSGSAEGLKLRELVKAQLIEAGVPSNMIIIPIDDNLKRDPNDVLKAMGLKALRKHLDRITGRGKLLTGKISKKKLETRACIVAGWGETSRTRAALFGAKRSSPYTKSYTLKNGYAIDRGIEAMLNEIKKLGVKTTEAALYTISKLDLKPSVQAAIAMMLADEDHMIAKNTSAGRAAVRAGILQKGLAEVFQVGQKKYLKLNIKALRNLLKKVFESVRECFHSLRELKRKAERLFKAERIAFWSRKFALALRLGSPIPRQMPFIARIT